MQKPEGITQEQWDHLMKHLNSQPKIEVTEHGATESRMVWSKEELEARRQSRKS